MCSAVKLVRALLLKEPCCVMEQPLHSGGCVEACAAHRTCWLRSKGGGDVQCSQVGESPAPEGTCCVMEQPLHSGGAIAIAKACNLLLLLPFLLQV